MHPILGPGIILFLIFSIAYYWSFNKLYRIVLAEKPEWLQYKGEPSIFYQGMPRMADPNMGMQVLRVAFSGKIHQLTASNALLHAKAIRILLPAGVLLFGGIIGYIFCHSAP